MKRPSAETIAFLLRHFAPLQQRLEEASRARNVTNPLLVPPEPKKHKKNHAEAHGMGAKGNIVQGAKMPLAAEPREMMSRARVKRSSKKGQVKVVDNKEGALGGVLVRQAAAGVENKMTRKKRAPVKPKFPTAPVAPVEVGKEEEDAVAMEGEGVQSQGEGGEEEGEGEGFEPILNIGSSLPSGPTTRAADASRFMSLEATRYGMLPPIHMLVQGAASPSRVHLRPAVHAELGEGERRGEDGRGRVRGGDERRVANSPGPPFPPPHHASDGSNKRRRRGGELIRLKHEDRDAGHAVSRVAKEEVVTSWINALASEEV